MGKTLRREGCTMRNRIFAISKNGLFAVAARSVRIGETGEFSVGK
ncbi:hypothetical protein B4135_3960 [Caldibacillus debilis]|uniref:Uncharacterized protein n=1 Tax=Caldibacillus debilis TaxID=301148 RepID=A0A150LAL3_9BACI|nr:hypothetical protein B4135_3960 [Caldibacillus debilis]